MNSDVDDFGISKTNFRCNVDKSDVEALEYWKRLPGHFRLSLLNNAYCSICSSVTSFDTEYWVKTDDIIHIEGKCYRCKGSIVRTIE